MAGLRIAQVELGWLPTDAIEAVAEYLEIPPIAAYEVATFYNMYDTKKVGKSKIVVCTNLPCALSGGTDAAEYLKIVFCVSEDVAHPHLVETGISDATGVEIVNGISVDDRIVTGPFRGLDQLKEGSKVKIEKGKDEADAEDGEQAPPAAEADEKHANAETD